MCLALVFDAVEAVWGWKLSALLCPFCPFWQCRQKEGIDRANGATMGAVLGGRVAAWELAGLLSWRIRDEIREAVWRCPGDLLSVLGGPGKRGGWFRGPEPE